MKWVLHVTAGFWLALSSFAQPVAGTSAELEKMIDTALTLSELGTSTQNSLLLAGAARALAAPPLAASIIPPPPVASDTLLVTFDLLAEMTAQARLASRGDRAILDSLDDISGTASAQMLRLPLSSTVVQLAFEREATLARRFTLRGLGRGTLQAHLMHNGTRICETEPGRDGLICALPEIAGRLVLSFATEGNAREALLVFY